MRFRLYNTSWCRGTLQSIHSLTHPSIHTSIHPSTHQHHACLQYVLHVSVGYTRLCPSSTCQRDPLIYSFSPIRAMHVTDYIICITCVCRVCQALPLLNMSEMPFSLFILSPIHPPISTMVCQTLPLLTMSDRPFNLFVLSLIHPSTHSPHPHHGMPDFAPPQYVR